jgi:hypothetical protein
MTWKDQVFVANVVVTNMMKDIVVLSVISWPTCATTKLNTIAKIHKYKGFHEGHHFILMAMEVHGAFERDMDHFIKRCAHLFHDRWSRGHLFLSFCIQFFKQRVNIALQRALAFTIEKKIMLASDSCFRPPITIKSHDLCVGNIRRAMGEITFYHERD